MTIKQLPYGRMQGYVIVEEYNDETDETAVLWASEETSDAIIFPKDLRNREIEYMYAAERDGVSAIIIEVKTEDN